LAFIPNRNGIRRGIKFQLKLIPLLFLSSLDFPILRGEFDFFFISNFYRYLIIRKGAD
jgi:hypothetical protein